MYQVVVSVLFVLQVRLAAVRRCGRPCPAEYAEQQQQTANVQSDMTLCRACGLATHEYG